MLVFLGNVMLFFDCQTFMEYIFILKLLSWLFVFLALSISVTKGINGIGCDRYHRRVDNAILHWHKLEYIS